MQPLRIGRDVLDAVLAHARETHPEECCGALVRKAGRLEAWRLQNVQNELHRRDPAGNPRTAVTAYALGVADVERLDGARAGDPAVGTLEAIYHSHTKVGAYFSGEDRARAMFGDEPLYPEIAWLVVSDSRETGEARAFRWDDEQRDFLEVAVDAG
jgi:[CysO sulfur-carrier protein]-S-L-cysteine hydrolase